MPTFEILFSVNCLFNKPGTLLSTGDILTNKVDKNLCYHEAYILLCALQKKSF